MLTENVFIREIFQVDLLLEAMAETIGKEVGVIDILVNNAGIIKRILTCDMSAAELR